MSSELCFVSEDPTIVSSRYASRISQKSWQKHRPVIQSLHEKGLTRREILSELPTCQHFNPSFGQLVAQMIKWRLVRYSKASPTSSPTPAMRVSALPGIMGVSSVLLAAEPSSLISQDDNTWAGTSYELTQLISDLRITSDNNNDSRRPPTNIPNPDSGYGTSYNIQRRRELLDAADMLFLGGSHAHAYHTYRQAYKLPLHPQASLEESLDEEQLQVQGIIGCLKSSATDEQQDESIYTAQRFLDGLEEWYGSEVLIPGPEGPSWALLVSSSAPPLPSSSSSSLPPRIRTAFETWDSSDCAASKAIFDLLTHYKRYRTADIVPPKAAWAHRVTLHEWMCMRLVRVPAWQDAVAFRLPLPSALLSAPLQPQPSLSFHPNNIHKLAAASTVIETTIFDPENLASILQFTSFAIRAFETWYDEQVSTLRAACTLSLSTFQALLFWRLAFFSKHSSQIPCPQLRVRLSPDVVYVTSPLQTAGVMAHVLLNDDMSPCIDSAAHLQMLENMQVAIEKEKASEWVFPLLWTGLKAKFAPAFAERRHS